MSITEHILEQVAYSIANNEYIWTDHEKVAIISGLTSAGEWDELLAAVSAFLNTKGGAVIIGIEDNEDAGQYIFHGVEEDIEGRLPIVSERLADITDATGAPFDVSPYVAFNPHKFMAGNVLSVLVSPLPEAMRYAWYKNAAYERTVTGNHRLTHLKSTQAGENMQDNRPAEHAGNITETDSGAEAPVPVQKIYSAELISIFGADYISLEPDYKQMLSYIYERNKSDTPHYPDANEISARLWALKGEVRSKKELELFHETIRKIVAIMEKTGFILRQKSKPGYKINAGYEVVKNLFN